MNWGQEVLSLNYKGNKMQIPITFTRTNPVNAEEEESEEEFSDEYEEDYEYEEVYYFGTSSEEDLDSDLDYNPWINESSPQYQLNDMDVLPQKEIYSTYLQEEEDEIISQKEEQHIPRFVLNILYAENKGVFLSKRLVQHMNGLLQSPGGKVEKNETSMEAVLRETLEETSLKFQAKDVNYLFNDSQYNCDVYLTKINRKYPRRTEPKKASDWILYDFDRYEKLAKEGKTTTTHTSFIEEIMSHLTDVNEELFEEYFGRNNPAQYLAEIMASEKEKPKKELNIGPLEYHQQQQLDNLLVEYKDICAKNVQEIGQTTAIKHTIPTGDHRPINLPYYQLNPTKRDFVRKEVEEMKKNGIIRDSKSPWAAPVVIVGKKDGTQRFCIDYRKLNTIITVNSHPLPRIDDIIDTFGGCTWFTSMDLASGYWQIAMAPEDIQKTAFKTPDGLYEFLVMPFGLNNAPATFQRLMNWLLREYTGDFVKVYLRSEEH